MRLKKLIYPLFDALLIGVALIAAFLLRFGFNIPIYYIYYILFLLPYVIVLKITVFYIFGFYSQLWKYASLKEGIRLFKGISAASLILLGSLFLAYATDVPRAALIIDWLLTLCFIGGSRFIIRASKDLVSPTSAKSKNLTKQKKAIVIGAGEVGSMLVKHMQRHPEWGYSPIAFLDDNPSKKGLMVHGVKVVGNTRAIPGILANYPADEIILAIPLAPRQERRRIALECREIGMPCKTVPDITELDDNEGSITKIRDIDVKELLGRKEVELDFNDIVESYKDKVILITGAAGSIGSELCRQAIALNSKKVIAADISENGLYHLSEEMSGWINGNKEVFEIRVLDIKNECAIDRLFDRYRPDVVFHAAAYKHVPMMESHPVEALENNFLGTRNLIEAANRYRCERFSLISTDKAVKPTSMMGLSKKLGEQSIKIAANDANHTKFMAVRFGNVLGSNGSVIPKFKRQIGNREPITVTHPDITRYFMTIHEAVYLVIQATARGNGGEIFVLDMGEPVRIIDLAKSLIRLCGFEPEKDIPIVITGLRPGEKMHEELFAEDEVVSKTNHSQVFEVCDSFNIAATVKLLKELETTIRAGGKHAAIEVFCRNQLIHAEHTAEPLLNPRVSNLPVGNLSARSGAS